MRPGWSGTQLPNFNSHTTPEPPNGPPPPSTRIGETREFAGETQLQRFAQFVEAHQDTARLMNVSSRMRNTTVSSSR